MASVFSSAVNSSATGKKAWDSPWKKIGTPVGESAVDTPRPQTTKPISDPKNTYGYKEPVTNSTGTVAGVTPSQTAASAAAVHLNDADFLKSLWNKGGFNPEDVTRVKALAANGNKLAAEWLKSSTATTSASKWGGSATTQQLVNAGFNVMVNKAGAGKQDPTIQAANSWGPITYDQNTKTYNQSYYEPVLGRMQQTKSVSWQEGGTPVATVLGSTDAGRAKQAMVNSVNKQVNSGGTDWNKLFSSLGSSSSNQLNYAQVNSNNQKAILKKRAQENYDKTAAIRGQSGMKMTRP
jgi:hypothetical protein